MNKTQSAALRSFRRVREFLTAHGPADGPPSFAKKVVELEDIMSAMAQQANEQNTGTRLGAGEAKRQRALRETLWNDYMVPIADVARAIYGVPGVKEALKLPTKSADNDRLLSAANGMANAAEADKAVFLEHGLRDDFVDQLKAATKALADALVTRVETGRRRVKATAAVQEQVKRGARAVQVLNAILGPTLRRSPDLKAAWDIAKARSQPAGGGPGVPFAALRAGVIPDTPTPSPTTAVDVVAAA
jgi:hypothetical protein